MKTYVYYYIEKGKTISVSIVAENMSHAIAIAATAGFEKIEEVDQIIQEK